MRMDRAFLAERVISLGGMLAFFFCLSQGQSTHAQTQVSGEQGVAAFRVTANDDGSFSVYDVNGNALSGQPLREEVSRPQQTTEAGSQTLAVADLQSTSELLPIRTPVGGEIGDTPSLASRSICCADQSLLPTIAAVIHQADIESSYPSRGLSEITPGAPLLLSDATASIEDVLPALGTPNLFVYTGTGSDNTYLYNPTTHLLTLSTSVGNDGTVASGSFRTGAYLSDNMVISTLF